MLIISLCCIILSTGNSLPQDPFAPLPSLHSPGNPFMPSPPTTKDDPVHDNDLSPQATSQPMQTQTFQAETGSDASEKQSSTLTTPESGCHSVVDSCSSATTSPVDTTVTVSADTASAWIVDSNGGRVGQSDACESFSAGFGDDFGALSQTEVMFKTGLVDSDFKAVAGMHGLRQFPAPVLK